MEGMSNAMAEETREVNVALDEVPVNVYTASDWRRIQSLATTFGRINQSNET